MIQQPSHRAALSTCWHVWHGSLSYQTYATLKVIRPPWLSSVLCICTFVRLHENWQDHRWFSRNFVVCTDRISSETVDILQTMRNQQWRPCGDCQLSSREIQEPHPMLSASDNSTTLHKDRKNVLLSITIRRVKVWVESDSHRSEEVSRLAIWEARQGSSPSVT